MSNLTTVSKSDKVLNLIERNEDFIRKYEELQLSDNDTTDPLAVGKVIKFSNNSDLINLEQTSDMVEGPEEKFNNLERNVDKKEQKLQKNNGETKSINEGKLECSTCNKYFAEKHVLNRHIQSVHEKQKLFECSTCSKKLSRKDQLKLHIESAHENKKTLECTSCMKRFSCMDHLKLHIACVHDNKKEFMCLICEKGFSRKDKLKNHISSVHEKERS